MRSNRVCTHSWLHFAFADRAGARPRHRVVQTCAAKLFKPMAGFFGKHVAACAVLPLQVAQSWFGRPVLRSGVGGDGGGADRSKELQLLLPEGGAFTVQGRHALRVALSLCLRIRRAQAQLQAAARAFCAPGRAGVRAPCRCACSDCEAATHFPGLSARPPRRRTRSREAKQDPGQVPKQVPECALRAERDAERF